MKKLFVLLLALALVFAFAACGAAPADDATESEEAAEETAEETAEEPAQEAAEKTTEETAAGIVEIDGNTITLGDDGSEKASSQDGIEKAPLVSARDINATYQTGPMTITVNKVQLSNIKVSDQSTADMMNVPKDETVGLLVIDLTAENTSTDDITFYPNQSVIVTNTKEQINCDLWFSDSVGGDFLGQVVKNGQIYFFFSSPADEVNHIQWRIDSPFDTNYENVGDTLVVEFELVR